MVLTEENKTDIYQATMEPGKRAFEVALFGDKVNSTANPLPAGFEEEVPFPYIFTNSNRTVSMLNGNTPGRDIGPGVILKVMAGDKIRARSFAWHLSEGDRTSNLPAEDIIANMLTLLTPNLANVGKGTAAQNITSDILQPGMEALLATHAASGLKPRAYINWILLDEEQFKEVSGSYGSTLIPDIPVGGNKQVLEANDGNDIEMKKNGISLCVCEQ